MLPIQNGSFCQTFLQLSKGLEDEDGIYKAASHWLKNFCDKQPISNFQESTTNFHRISQLSYIQTAPHIFIEKVNFYRHDDELVKKLLFLFDVNNQEVLSITKDTLHEKTQIGLFDASFYSRIQKDYNFDIRQKLPGFIS